MHHGECKRWFALASHQPNKFIILGIVFDISLPMAYMSFPHKSLASGILLVAHTSFLAIVTFWLSLLLIGLWYFFGYRCGHCKGLAPVSRHYL